MKPAKVVQGGIQTRGRRAEAVPFSEWVVEKLLGVEPPTLTVQKV